ncbi:hypothetical protein SLS57_004555 [Botryosphaeria dothidea]
MKKIVNPYAASASSLSSSRGPRRSEGAAAQQRGQYSLEAFLQGESHQYRPPIDLWQGDRGGFQERLAAANYSFPPQQRSAFAAEDHQYPYATSISLDKSSMAPSNQPPPQIHNRGPSTVASASQYASSSYAGGPPSLDYDGTSYAESSVDTELGKLMSGVRLLEEGPDGVLVRPGGAGVAATVYECTFGFLGCRFFATDDEGAWRTHNLSHFHGHSPPRRVECPLCDFGFQDPRDGYRAWEARMSHLAAHMRHGQTLATSRPDFNLYRYLWQKRIIDDAEWKELNGGGVLSGVRSDAALASGGAVSSPLSTTQGSQIQDRRERRPRHARHNRVEGYDAYAYGGGH